MAKQLCINYIKCIKPSSGIPSSVLNLLEKTGTALGIFTESVLKTTVIGGILVKVSGINGKKVGEKLTVTVLDVIDDLFSGKDDLYIKINNDKVWPTDKIYQTIDSQKKVTFPTIDPISLDKQVTITLYDHDIFSSDDVISEIKIRPHIEENVYTYVVAKKSENSIYEIQITVTDNK